MERLLCGGLAGRFGKSSWDSDNCVGQFLQGQGRGEGAKERMERFCAPEQWEAAMDAVWSRARSHEGSSYQTQEMGERLFSAMEYWMELSTKLGMEPFDMDRLSKGLLRGWEAAVLGGSSAAEVARIAEKITKMACSKKPASAGGLLLDLLDRQGQSEVIAAQRVWIHCAEAKAKLALPESHPLLSEPGRVGERLANHPLWREIEEHVIERASAPARRVRL